MRALRSRVKELGYTAKEAALGRMLSVRVALMVRFVLVG